MILGPDWLPVSALCREICLSSVEQIPGNCTAQLRIFPRWASQYGVFWGVPQETYGTEASVLLDSLEKEKSL